MTVTFEFWQLLTLLIGLAGIFAGLVKILLRQMVSHVDRSLVAIRDDSTKWHELELKFYQHLAALPVEYVRREDYVRGQTVIEAKLDAISSELKTVQINRGG